MLASSSFWRPRNARLRVMMGRLLRPPRGEVNSRSSFAFGSSSRPRPATRVKDPEEPPPLPTGRRNSHEFRTDFRAEIASRPVPHGRGAPALLRSTRRRESHA
jgi:hypothetical protein